MVVLLKQVKDSNLGHANYEAGEATNLKCDIQGLSFDMFWIPLLLSLTAVLDCFRADIALIGLAVMGQNLILNMNDHGFVVCVYNRTTEKVDQFLANEAKGTKIIGAHSLEDMVQKLKKPKRIMMLVKGKFVFNYNVISTGGT